MATTKNEIEYRSDDMGGYCYPIAGTSPRIRNDLTGVNILAANSIFHLCTVHAQVRYRRQGDGGDVNIYDGVVAAARKRRMYFITTLRTLEVVNIRGLRFESTTGVFIATNCTTSVFVHCGGVRRNN